MAHYASFVVLVACLFLFFVLPGRASFCRIATDSLLHLPFPDVSRTAVGSIVYDEALTTPLPPRMWRSYPNPV